MPNFIEIEINPTFFNTIHIQFIFFTQLQFFYVTLIYAFNFD
jgi:hypothetical protein